PSLELEVADALAARLPGVLVSRSSQVWPEIREYERALVAALNAYIHPLLENYYATLTRRMAALGIAAPLYITASNGGALSVDSARARPIDTVLSGPASGVVAAARIAAVTGRAEIITFDMGGTSSDFAVSKGGEPEYTTRTDVGDFPLILPVVNVSSIGAGGGSIVSVDRHGVLKVGPESAGADPGPASYSRGGTNAAITDCYVATGIIDPDAFLGGRMKLDRAAAISALDRVADRLGLGGGDRAAQAAEAALNVTTAKMATELFKGLAQRGLDPRGFALIPFGGAGPTHANLLAEEARQATIVVPPGPGTFCALGAIMSDVKRDYVRTVRRRLDDAGAARALTDTIAALERDALDWVGREGAIVDTTSLSAEADMRYAGQAYELHVAIPDLLRRTMTASDIAELFHRAHEHHYGFRDADSAIEVVTLRVRVIGRVPPIAIPEVDKAVTPAESSGRRQVFHRGQWHEVPVFQRDRLRQGQGFAGPALIEQEDTTTWILPGWRARVDAVGNLMISKG
ncbi:MAG: hydantoinase/oxoprolinase family protein, partial [Alphaproteobacteria bacterium]|nr:hydantoinase/oxoprolinase family protein [Alphaproteobacteria bacterium]